MPPTEDIYGHCDDVVPLSNVQQLANAVRTMLRNGIINNANRVLLDPIDPYAGTPVPYLPNLRDLLVMLELNNLVPLAPKSGILILYLNVYIAAYDRNG